MGTDFSRDTGEAPEQPTIQSERMQRRCANTPPTSFENTSPGSWQPCSPSSLCCSGELLQEGHLQEQDPGLPGLKDCELTGNHSSTLLSLCRFAARLMRNAWRGYTLLLCTMSVSPWILLLVLLLISHLSLGIKSQVREDRSSPSLLESA